MKSVRSWTNKPALLVATLLAGCAPAVALTPPHAQGVSPAPVMTPSLTPAPPTFTPNASPTTTLPPDTATPAATSTPANTAAPAPESIARQFGFFVEGRTYSDVIENGVAYILDDYNGALMRKKQGSEWVDTTLEEKYGQLAPVDGSYAVQESVDTRGAKETMFTVYWTGDYVTTTLHFDEPNLDIPVTVVTYVTRDSVTKILKRVEDTFLYPGKGVVLDTPEQQIYPFYLPLKTTLDVYAKHGIDLLHISAQTLAFINNAAFFVNFVKTQYPSCTAKDVSEVLNLIRLACYQRLSLQQTENGKIDFGGDVKTKLTGGADGAVILLFESEVQFKVGNLSKGEVMTIQQELDTLTADLPKK